MGDRQPLYIEVQKKLIKLIKNDELSNPLPNEHKLAEKMEVSRTTIREAIRSLVNSGILYKKHGAGTFIRVSKKSINENLFTGLEELRGIQNIIRNMGKNLSYKRQDIDVVYADDVIANNLQISKDDEVLKVTQTYLADEVPVIMGESYIQPSILEESFFSFGKAVIRECKNGKSLFEVLENRTEEKVQHALTEIEAISADENQAEELGIEKNYSLILLKESHSNLNGFPLIYSKDYINTKVFSIYLKRKRGF